MKTCMNARQRRYFGRMSIAAETMAEVLALPEQDRAYLARQLITSLDDTVDASAEEEWNKEIARRIAELDSGQVKPIPWAEARRQVSSILNGR